MEKDSKRTNATPERLRAEQRQQVERSMDDEEQGGGKEGIMGVRGLWESVSIEGRFDDPQEENASNF